jgi:multidrug efflux pump subunit AcrA (membrane-fusion protein)
MRILTTLIAGVLVAGCGGAAAHAPARGWVTGVALTGRPLCPTPTAQESLCHPAPRAHAVVTVTGAAGSRRVLAGANGRFRVALAPGRYVIRSGAARPVSVRVIAGRVAEVHMRLSFLHVHG